MDLRQLRYFLAVVDEGGVHRAAAALHVAQPSLSQALRKLEHDLGANLFHRIGRRLVLSPAGEALLGPARQMLRTVDAAYDAVREVADVEAGRLDVASLADLSADPTAIWVARFRVANRGVTARVEERGYAAQVADLVRTGECEIGVTVLPLPEEYLAQERLLTQHFVLITPPGSEEALPATVSLASLSGVPLVMGERHATTREWVESTLRAHGVEPSVAVEVPQRGAVIPMVLNGAGAAVVPLRLALDARLHDAVVRELDPPLTREVGLLHRPGALTAAAAAFLAHTRDGVASWSRAVERRRRAGAGLIEAAASTERSVRHRLRSGFASDPPAPTHDDR
ncbi:LysR family transcriptional regulator [Actinomycetospora chibensis]|uniref:LysR family transcriptional regulator n=1 Tax=Actinomycetospora chibensis TaxID=663606 RepID=A0ABV9RDH4_9PSEU|nr:LysR substrate-binding domain-containing protein [Actinomycetospora chibensis]MDD7926642.1 LysR substrate-binding domain-containing protein [Actinomycetospora chibensis]